MISFKEYLAEEEKDFEQGHEELYFDDVDDFKAAISIANDLSLEFMIDEAELELLISLSNSEEALDNFYDRLEEYGLDFNDEEDEYELDEKALLKKIKPADKRKAKLDYKKNKGKLKLKAKKFRKSAAGKKLKRKAKLMKKRGKTSTGKRITRKT